MYMALYQLYIHLFSLCVFVYLCVCVCYRSFVFIFCVCVSVTKGQHGVELHWYVAQRSVSITHPSFFPWGKATKGTDRYICAYIEPLETGTQDNHHISEHLFSFLLWLKLSINQYFSMELDVIKYIIRYW